MFLEEYGVDVMEISHFIDKQFGKPKILTAWVGGSGTWDLAIPEVLKCAGEKTLIQRLHSIITPFGTIPKIILMEVDSSPVIRIPLHGWKFPQPTVEQTLATYWLLYKLGVRQVVTDASVGGIGDNVKPWDIVIPDDVINNDPSKFTLSRLPKSLGRDPWVRMTSPFCSRIRNHLKNEVVRLDKEGTEEPHHPLGNLHVGGTYYTMPLGPFETAAEIRQLKKMGMTVVGQSSGQEALAARMCCMCLAVINPVANYAEGLEGGQWTPEGMDKFYEECQIPMAVVTYRTVQRMVADAKSGHFDCQCEKIGKSADLSAFTNPKD